MNMSYQKHHRSTTSTGTSRSTNQNPSSTTTTTTSSSSSSSGHTPPPQHRHYIPTQCLKSIPGFIADTNIIDVTHLILIDDDHDNDDDDNDDHDPIEQRDDVHSNTASQRTRSRRHTGSYTVIHNRNRVYYNHKTHQPKSTVEADNSATTTTTTTTQLEYTTCDSSSSTDTTTNMGSCHIEIVDIPHSFDSDTTAYHSLFRKTDRIMFSYAREKGYLFLSSSSTPQNSVSLPVVVLPISTQYVYISKQDSLCFGEPFLQYLIFHLLYYILGPDTIMINWILGTFYRNGDNRNTGVNTYTDMNHNINHHTNNTADPYMDTTYHSGYIYNPRTSEVIDMDEYQQQLTHYGNAKYYSNGSHQYQWWIRRKLYEMGLKLLIVIKTSFLFFITTTLVSFTLRETQGRMLQFTHTLQQQCFNPATVTDHRSNNNHNNNNNNNNNTNDPNAPQQHQQQQLNYNMIIQLVMTHVLENVIFVPIIVGFIYFLINFYNGDKFLAFMVLTLVWVCESFSMVRYVPRHTINMFTNAF
jgi:hypothetical protein